MKYIKQLSVIFALVIIAAGIFLLPAEADASTIASGTCGTGVTWTLDDTGTLTISGTGPMDDFPDWSDGNPWYAHRLLINKAVIETGVTTVGSFSFWYAYPNLQTVIISDSVETIGESAFVDCSGLRKIVVDDNNNYFSTDDFGALFDKKRELLIRVPGGMSGSYQIPDGVTEIGYGALRGCKKLTDVLIPGSVSQIGPNAFYCCSSLKTVSIPENVRRIENSTFGHCNNLETVLLPDNINFIGEMAFDECENLNYSIYDSMKYLGNSKNPYLVAVVAESEDMTSCNVHTNTKVIASYAFDYCHYLESVILPEGLCTIGDSAFGGCGLREIEIPESVVTIGSYAFACNYGLTSVKIPEGTVSLGESIFYGCENLETVTLPNTLEYLGPYAFDECGNLKFNNYGGMNYLGNSENPYLVAVVAETEDILSCSVHKDTKILGGNAFHYCFMLKTVTLPEKLKIIGDGAFSGCMMLAQINIPQNITYIGEGAFENCSDLQQVVIPNGITEVKSETYYGCGNIASVTIPKSVVAIERGAFAYCQSLQDITIPLSVMDIGEHAFEDCVALTNVYYGGTEKQWADIAIAEDNEPLKEATLHCVELIAEGTCGENLTWTLNSNGTLTISGTGAMADYASASASPWYSQRELIVSITVEGGVTSIGDRAFYNCTELTDVTIGEAVTTVGTYAFRGCTKLESITLPASVTELKASAFRQCSNLANIILLGNAPIVGNYAFTDCAAAITVQYYEGSTGYDATPWTDYTQVAMHVGQWVVDQEATCTQEGSRHITCTVCGETVTETIPFGHNYYNNICTLCGETKTIASGTCGSNAAWRLDALGTLTVSGSGWMSSYYSNGSAPWYEFRDQIKTVIIGNGITSIGSYAFFDCSSLTSITIPESVTSIGWCAFSYCSSLTGITIPDSVESIDNYAFSGCSSLTSINIPESVTSIGEGAFDSCSSLTGITIPDSVTSIGSAAFYHCSSLTSINIPDSVESIGFSAFSGCSSLESITIPFVGGSKKTSSDTYQYPFGYIFGTSSYTGGVATKQYYYGKSTSITTDSTYYIPASLKTVTVTGGNILCGAFWGCSSLTSITIPDGVTSIGNSAFYGCSSLTSINIPDSVESIGNYAFENCSSLTSITIPESVTTIGDDAFSYCSSLTSINIPDSVESIGNYAFKNCSSLTSITIPESVTSIGNYAFYHCSSLTSITIPESVTRIGNYAFYHCSSLTSITIPDSVTTIGGSAFRSCTSLTSITIPDGVTSIGDGAFWGCSSLTTVFYGGTEAQKSEISIDSDNSNLTNARWHYEVVELLRGGVRIYQCGCCGKAFFADGTETIPGTLKQLNITNLPDKLSYIVGEELSLNGLTLEGEYADSSKVAVTVAMLENIQADLSTPGRKTVTLTVAGATAEFEIIVHSANIETVTVDPAQYPYPESAHNYGNNANETKTFTYPGAQSLVITFSSQTETESGYDCIYIYDGGGTQIAKYSGTAAAGKTLTVSGDTFKVKLTSDGGVNRYGYSFTGIQANFAELIHDLVAGEITPPTETAQGYTTYHCSYGCGYTEQRDFTDYKPETPADPSTAVPEGETLRLRGTNVDFASSLTLNFNNYAEDLSQYEDVYVIFEAEGKEPVKVTEYTVSNGRWNFGYEGLTIMDVNLTIKATIYGTKDGVLYKDSKVRTYTLLQYASKAILDETNDKVPCANLLKYAIAAESYKGKTALADTLTAEQTAAMNKFAYADDQFAASSTNKTTSNAVGEKMKFSGQSVNMDSRITLIYKMELVDKTLDMSKVTFKISYTDAWGNAQVKDYTIDDAEKTSEGYEMYFAEFHATQLKEQALLTVYIDGVEHCSYGNSVENYCYVINKNSSSDPTEMVALAKRILLYGDACAATYGK